MVTSCDELASLLGKRFVVRTDVKAVQHPSGAYHPERTKFTVRDIARHLRGEVSLGHYLVSPQNRCKLFAFDLDLEKVGTVNGEPIEPREVWAGEETPEKAELRADLLTLATGMACRLRSETPFPVSVAYSGGKGVHVYCFTGPAVAETVREFALSFLEGGPYEPTKGLNFWKHRYCFPNIGIEVFPKQATVDSGEGLGNLMRLPLGRNARTGQPGFFLQPNCWEAADPTQALTTGTVTPEWLQESAR